MSSSSIGQITNSAASAALLNPTAIPKPRDPLADAVSRAANEVLGEAAAAAGSGKTSLEALISTAQRGDINAQAELGNMYYLGKDVPEDLKQAFYWCSEAAEKNHAHAQYRLGTMYEIGKGVLQSHAKAFYWYSKAAENGDISSQWNVGNMYRYGKGVQQDLKQAIHWFTKAAERAIRKLKTI